MTLQELRSLVRRRMRDEETTPHLIDDEEIDANLNEAQREACVRALLIEGDVDLDVTTTDLRYTLDPKVIDVIGISTSAGNKFYDAWTLTESHLELARLPTADDTLTLRCYLLRMIWYPTMTSLKSGRSITSRWRIGQSAGAISCRMQNCLIRMRRSGMRRVLCSRLVSGRML